MTAEIKWQYGTMLRDSDGELFDLWGAGLDLLAAEADAEQWNRENSDDSATCVVVRRSAPVAAGEWKPIEIRQSS